MTYPISPYHGGGGYSAYPHVGGGYYQPQFASFGPYQSFGPTPFEQVNSRFYAYNEGVKGMVGGSLGGVLVGAAAGAAAGSAFFGIGAIPGAIIGGIAGLFGGAGIGKFVGERQAIHRDATDDGTLNGSPLLYGMEAQNA